MKSLRLTQRQLATICERASEARDTSSSRQLETLKEELINEFNTFRSIVDETLSTNPDDPIINKYVQLEKSYNDAKLHLQELIDDKTNLEDTLPNNDLMSLISNQNQLLGQLNERPNAQHNIKLPNIDIPQFHGDRNEWLTFRDLYIVTIHENKSLNPVQKLHYLKTLLRGEASCIVKSIPTTADNYSKAWDLVMSHYNKPYLIVRSIIEKFLSCDQVSQNCQNLRNVINLFNETTGLLDAQGAYASSRDPWLIQLMLNKLDNYTKRAWAEEASTNESPSLQEFQEFLNDRCTTIEIFSSNNHKSRPEKPFASKLNSIQILKHTCVFCNENHIVHKCPKFSALSLADRNSFVVKEKRCENCLLKNHNTSECRSKYNCSKCGARHHSLLHKSPDKASTSSPTSTNVVKLNSGLNPSAHSIIPTAMVLVSNTLGHNMRIRILLDTGAQSNFISLKLVKLLGIKREQTKVPVSCLSSFAPIYSKGRVEIELKSQYDPSYTLSVSAQILPTLIESLPNTFIELTCVDELKTQFDLADPKFNSPSEIDMILNASKFFEVLKSDRWYHPVDKLFISDTHFGCIVCSKDEGSHLSSISLNTSLTAPCNDNLDKTLEQFWTLEEPPLTSSRPLSAADSTCETLFSQTTTRLPSGRFSVRLPFRDNSEKLGLTYETAVRRLYSLERKLALDKNFHAAYLDFMHEYENLGHMVKIPASDIDLTPSQHFIIPHHGIWQQSCGKNKLRVVFDASAKSSTGISLNDILYSGPALQLDLTSIINNFRTHQFVMSADICKMYRQISVNENDQSFQIILWRSSPNESISFYKLTTVTYGQSCSPFLALRTIQELVNQDGYKFPDAARILTTSRFVDDIFWGSNDLSELQLLKTEITNLLKLGGFELGKWVSNSPNALRDIPTNDLIDPVIFRDSFDQLSVKTLGIRWIPKEDYFSFKISLENIKAPTKRMLLSDSAKLFDPMGWISPVTVKLKMIFQTTWILKIDWDQKLSNELYQSWMAIRSKLHLLHSLKIPRWIRNGVLEIHGYADASESAFGAVLYSRITDSEGRIHVHLIASKTKLSPIKQISIPRLELCAAHLLARLVASITPTYAHLNPRYILWSDSEIVLAWLHSTPKKWSSFVGNRITHIHELCPKHNWYHIDSKNNPADIASRGLLPDELIENQLWWHGPSFLQTEYSLPLRNLKTTHEEERSTKVCTLVNSYSYWVDIYSKFSSYNILIKTMAYILRLKQFRHLETRVVGRLTVSELKNAEIFIVIQLQKFYFQTEYQALSTNLKISPQSRIRTFCPFYDNHGLLRIGGRLQNCHLSEFEPHPIILPTCHFVELLIHHLHQSNFHLGKIQITVKIQKTYWVISLKRSVQKIIRSCKRCIRYRAETYQPKISPLPEARTNPFKPFSKVGLDFAGPISLRPYRNRGNLSTKGYFAVFVCLSTKAIHLELVMGLSTDCLILALQRFVARRGKVDEIWSDNGRNFVGCSRALKEFYKTICDCTNAEKTLSYCLNNKISWKFIPPYAPHFGGIWEAGVKNVKRHLSREFNGVTLTIEEFETALCRIESILNSRPLVPITFENQEPLTPNHFLIGSNSFNLPDITTLSESGSLSKRFYQINAIVNNFWRRWRNEYLATMMRSPKWLNSTKGPSVDDLVLIKRNHDPPRLWKMGKVIEMIPGKDSTTRVVKILTATGTHIEAIRNLIPLNVDKDASNPGTFV